MNSRTRNNSAILAALLAGSAMAAPAFAQEVPDQATALAEAAGTQFPQAGDHALAEFGRLLRDSLEPGDLAGRYGGEEFLCVLAHGGMARARAWGEALAQRVALGGLLWQGRVLPLTVSLGLAEREVGEGGIDAWIGRADRALYRAKHEGRNRVAVAE